MLDFRLIWIISFNFKLKPCISSGWDPEEPPVTALESRLRLSLFTVSLMHRLPKAPPPLLSERLFSKLSVSCACQKCRPNKSRSRWPISAWVGLEDLTNQRPSNASNFNSIICQKMTALAIVNKRRVSYLFLKSNICRRKRRTKTARIKNLKLLRFQIKLNLIGPFNICVSVYNSKQFA